jgi:putative hydrolase of the HAD superfamily
VTVEAVVFDLFDTLVEPWAGMEIAAGMAALLGVPAADLARCWDELRRPRERGAPLDGQVRAACERLGVVVDDERVGAALTLRTEIGRAGFRPRDDALATLGELRRRGLRIGLLSNCSADTPGLWRELELAALVDAAVFSSDVGYAKPDPEVYARCCELLGVRPEGTLFVDDNESNVAGARAAGLHAVRIGPGGEVAALSDVLGLVG